MVPLRFCFEWSYWITKLLFDWRKTKHWAQLCISHHCRYSNFQRINIWW